MVIKKIRKKRLISIIFIVLLLPSSIYHIALAETQDDNDLQNDTPIIDLFRIIQIDFDPPDIISECGSLFFLNVSIKKARLENLPRIFSLSVFLKTENKFDGNKITKIGSVPYVHMPYYQQQKSISVPCVTSNNLFDYIYCLRTGEKSEVKLDKGSIGVRIERIPRWCFDGFLFRVLNWFINLKIQIPWSIVNLFIGYFLSSHPQQFGETIKKMLESDNLPKTNKIRLFSFLQTCNSWLIDLNPSIVWKEVKLTAPFLCSTDIDFKEVSIVNKTDSNGKFNVTVEIANNLNIDIAVCVNVDVADEPLFVNLIPTFNKQSYNVGHFRDNISRQSSIKKTILCSFPENGMKNKNYDVTIECGPYIPIGDTNQFGLLFYDLRWIAGVKTYYEVNGTAQNSIKELWYNAPIFYGGSESASVFPVYHGLTHYYGEESPGELEELFKPVSEDIKNLIYLYLLCSLLIIGTACFCYCGLKMYLNKKDIK